MDGALTLGLMEILMKVSGRKANNTGEESASMVQATSMRASGKMIERTAVVLLHGLTEICTSESGRTTTSTEKERYNSGVSVFVFDKCYELNTLFSISMLMATDTKGNGIMTESRG